MICGSSKAAKKLRTIAAGIMMTTALACQSSNVVYAFTPEIPSSSAYAKKIFSDIKSNWLVSEQLPGPVKVTFDVVDDGTIYNPRIDKSCGNEQLDGECLGAVCASSPLEPLPNSLRTGKTFQIEVTFEPDATKKKLPVLLEYRRLHDLQKFEFAYFRIPPAVLSRFPGLMKEAEIHQLENLRKSDSGDIVYASHLWSVFFLNHPKPTREQLLNGPALI